MGSVNEKLSGETSEPFKKTKHRDQEGEENEGHLMESGDDEDLVDSETPPSQEQDYDPFISDFEEVSGSPDSTSSRCAQNEPSIHLKSAPNGRNFDANASSTDPKALDVEIEPPITENAEDQTRQNAEANTLMIAEEDPRLSNNTTTQANRSSDLRNDDQKKDFERVPVVVAFGSNNSWFIRWSDGACSWDGLPQTLHDKLRKRDSKLPGIKHLSLSESGEWFASFDDGSFAISGSCRESILKALQDVENENSDVNQLVFCPNGGFIITRDNGAITSERIPITLSRVISEYQNSCVNISKIVISKIGGWFVQFSDDECRWQYLPPRLEAIISKLVRKEPNSIILAFSPSGTDAYFISFGSFFSTTIKNKNFLDTINWARGKTDQPPKVLVKTPQIIVETYTNVYGQFFETLENIEYDVGNSSPLTDATKLSRKSTNSDILKTPNRNTNDSPVTSELLADNMDDAMRLNDILNSNVSPVIETKMQHGIPGRNGSKAQMFSTILSSVTSIFGAKSPGSDHLNNTKSSLIDLKSSMVDKLNNVISSLKVRYDQLDPHSPNKDSSMRMIDHINDLVHYVNTADTQENIFSLAKDAEFYSLFTEGWLEATQPNPAPSPWLDGWFQGRFGCDLNDVVGIMERFALMQRKSEDAIPQDNSQ